jgi:transposase
VVDQRAEENATGTGSRRVRHDGADLRRCATLSAVGPHYGLAQRRLLSGTAVDVVRHISRRGDGEVRTALYEAASAMMTRSRHRSALKAWGTQLAAKRDHQRAVVAVAPKLAVVMHRM